MSIVEQIEQNLVDRQAHGPILRALVGILEEEGEKAVRDHIKRWVQEIMEQTHEDSGGEEA